MTPRSVLASALLPVLLAAGPARAWQDLAEPYVQGQLEKLVDRKAPAGDKLRATWALVDAGRAAVSPLAELATKQPKLAWEAVRLMDLIRTDAEVPRRFSGYLDAMPAGLRKVPGARASLQSRLEDMLGRRFGNAAERAAWLRANGDYLRYDPARFAYLVDEAARTRRQPLVPTPPAQSGREATDRVYASLILALHLGNVEIVRSLRQSSRLYGLRAIPADVTAFASFHEHGALLDLVAAGDADGAEALMRRHIGHVRGIWADPALGSDVEGGAGAGAGAGAGGTAADG